MMKRKVLCAFAFLVMANSVDANPIYNLYRWAGEGIGLLEKFTPPPGLNNKALSFFQTYILAPVASVVPEAWRGYACTLGFCTFIGLVTYLNSLDEAEKERKQLADAEDAGMIGMKDGNGNKGKADVDSSDEEDAVQGSDDAQQGVQFYEKALILAAFEGHASVIRLLVEQRININIDATNDDGKTALIIAAEQGHVDVVELLINKGASKDVTDNLGQTALDKAVEAGRQEVIDILRLREENI